MEKFYIGQVKKLATTINFTSETSHSFEKAHVILQGRKSSMVVRKKKRQSKNYLLVRDGNVLFSKYYLMHKNCNNRDAMKAQWKAAKQKKCCKISNKHTEISKTWYF